MKGYVHSFESLAAVDGDGLRCAVFLSGCPIRCIYCHNPDTWDISSGKEVSPRELAGKIARYKTYFGKDGGVTFSGGEPLMQADFIKELIPLLENEGIGYIVDTSGTVELTETVQEVLEHSQSVLLDIKFWDRDTYKKYSGADMDYVTKTLEYLEKIRKKTVIRTVIVPGINDSTEILEKYVAKVKGYSCIARYELLGFHTMGFFKYENLGISNRLVNVPPLDSDKKNILQAYVNEALQKDLS